jgi:histidinol-phosphate phosphatase family protein
MQAMILAGGKGTRLASRLNGRPKPLVDVEGIPLLERQLRELSRNGVREVLILVNHAAEQIEAFIEHRSFGCRIGVINDGEPLGTAGAVLACWDRLNREVLVVYGDTLFDIDIGRMQAKHHSAKADATLFIHPNDHPADSDLIEVDDEEQIVAFHSYPHPPGAILPNLVNAAFYIVNREFIFEYRNFRTPADFAKDLFPAALCSGARLQGYRSFEYIKDLGTPARLDKVERQLREGVVIRARRSVPKPAVFFDRDGTLNELRGYVRRPEDLILFPGVANAIKRLNDRERRVVVVTNQPVIARGDCSVEELRRIHAGMDSQLGREGAYIDALYYCPHHTDRGYPGEVISLKIDCECRKPKTGLIERAITDLNIDRRCSFLVGDSSTDILAARRSGLQSILVLTGEGGKDERVQILSDYRVRDVTEAVAFILDAYPRIVLSLEALVERIACGDFLTIDGCNETDILMVTSVLCNLLRAKNVEASRIFVGKGTDQTKYVVSDKGDVDEFTLALSPGLAGGSTEVAMPLDEIAIVTQLSQKLGARSVVILEGVGAQSLLLSTKRRRHNVFVKSEKAGQRKRVNLNPVDRGSNSDGIENIFGASVPNEVSSMENCAAVADYVFSMDMFTLSRRVGP